MQKRHIHLSKPQAEAAAAQQKMTQMLVRIKGRDTSCKGRPKQNEEDWNVHSKYLQRVSGHVNVRGPKTFTVCESRHFLEVSTDVKTQGAPALFSHSSDLSQTTQV